MAMAFDRHPETEITHDAVRVTVHRVGLSGAIGGADGREVIGAVDGLDLSACRRYRTTPG
ncbi:MAG: hypothetical protein AAGG38_14970 [Planctomycetota bacterium]